MFDLAELKIAVIGLGYVGLPLALEFGKRWPTIGLDLNQQRIDELDDGLDATGECDLAEIRSSTNLRLSSHPDDLLGANFYVVTVPTPIYEDNRPDLRAIQAASQTVGRSISRGDIVVYESTVYPGLTEEICIPIVEKESGLVFNQDFFAGYSPERINPGDKNRRLADIVKVTSGSTSESAVFIDSVYREIVTAGTHLASSIKTAEAAKVIENTQRDLNIALVNELSIIFSKMNIDTQEVLEAAATKWNFQKFTPGLVGGHCIGVDPYYLTHKAQELGHTPEVILAGRRINDGMSQHVADRVISLAKAAGMPEGPKTTLVLGFAFKENCPDIRNTKVIDLVRALERRSIDVDVVDPLVSIEEVSKLYELKLLSAVPDKKYDCLILAVPHQEIIDMDISRYRGESSIVFDLKAAFPVSESDGRL